MKNLCLALLCFLVLNIAAHAQGDSSRLSSIVTKLNHQTATHPIEKVYLHLNKPDYQAGDTIWFKCYVTVGIHHQPSALSGLVYVDLLDDKDKTINTLKLKAENGITTGYIPTSLTQTPGDYRIRAYTTWMRNAGSEYFFNKTISIGTPESNSVFVSSGFDSSGAGRETPINARLTYTDKQGRPFGHKAVNYEVKADNNTLVKGSGITDEQGSLTLAFADKGIKGKAVIITHIKLLPDVTVEKNIPINLQSQSTDIQFFPEGGQLINGVRSKVAFKAIGLNGLSVAIKGTITDNEHHEVAEFTTQHAGMGIFALTPENGKTYTATLTLPDKSTTTVNLPKATDKGFVLAINNADSTTLSVRIATNPNTLNEQQNQPFYLVGQSAGAVYYTTLGKLDNASFTATIPKSKFPTGIAQFTLFSSSMQPLNERVVFIQNTDQLNLSLNTDKQQYKEKEPVKISFTARDNTNKPAAGSFSITVYNEDETTAKENAESTILTNTLLTSDLKGYIEEPNYYFNQPTDQTKADLDILMLTQGYRRFNWQDVINETTPAISYQPEKGLAIAGTLTVKKGKPVANGKVSVLSTIDKIALDTVSDKDGRFNFPDVEFPDTTRLVIKARTADDNKDVTITMDTPTPAPVLPATIGETADNEYRALKSPLTAKADSDRTAELLMIQKAQGQKLKAFNFQQNNKLKEITIKARKNQGTEFAPWQAEVKRSANLNGPGHANQVFDYHDLKDCDNLIDWLASRIGGIVRVGNSTDFKFVRHMAQSITHPPSVKFMLDGNFVTGDLVAGVNIGDILTVEVLKSSSYLSIYGTEASGGLIIITTKHGNEGSDINYNRPAPGMTATLFKGFNPVKHFYIPKYQYANTNDTRNAIYWNPDIITDATGKRTLEFYNSDLKGTYRAVVEGIDNDGHIGRYVYRYKVE
ncbi:MAG: TonB-dependent receptor [Mucilaginibacter sp.]